jgi:PPM family protein phosphatase
MPVVRAGASTHIGRVRRVNEDRALVTPVLLAVADGVGGHAAGDVASAMAVAGMERMSQLPDLTPAVVKAQLADCNRQILCAAEERGTGRAGMATTVAGMVLLQLAGTPHWVVFNVGDSRVYRSADDHLVQITVDHSEVTGTQASSVVGAEAARRHPRRRVVTRVLGMHPVPEPDLWVFPPTPGERFVICSDGLYEELADPEIAAVLRAYRDARTAAATLVAEAVAAGGRDNVTVVVADVLPVAADDVSEDTLRRAGRRPATAVAGPSGVIVADEGGVTA